MAEEISCYHNVELTGGEWKGNGINIIPKQTLSNNSLQEVSAKYWPNKGLGESIQVGQFVIEATSETEWDNFFIRRIMKVKMLTGIKVMCSLC